MYYCWLNEEMKKCNATAQSMEEKKLGDIGRFSGGTSFPESQQGGKKGVPFYKVSDMNLPSNNKIMLSANNYVSSEQIEINKWRPIKETSILFAKVGLQFF